MFSICGCSASSCACDKRRCTALNNTYPLQSCPPFAASNAYCSASFRQSITSNENPCSAKSRDATASGLRSFSDGSADVGSCPTRVECACARSPMSRRWSTRALGETSQPCTQTESCTRISFACLISAGLSALTSPNLLSRSVK